MGLGEVRPGYKRTEVGVIPEDWEVSTVGEHFEIQLGKMLDGARNFGTLKPYINNVAVRWGSFDLAEVGSVPLTSRDIARYRLVHGDLLVCEGGEIGRSAIWDDELTECYFQKTLHRLRSKACGEPAFFRYLLELWSSAGILDRFATQTSIAHLTKEVLAAMPLPVPERPQEQKLISDVLVSYERLLSQGKVLLAKKRDLKQAAMQELLRPKAGWHRKSIGELCRVNPETLSSTNTSPIYVFNYISLDDVQHGVCTGSTSQVFSFAPSRARRVVRQGDVLFGTVRPNLLSHWYAGDPTRDVICSTGFAVLRSDPRQVSAPYLFASLFASNITYQVQAVITGSNYPAMSSTEVASLEVDLPSSVDEQTAIAAILTDMDAEIAGLEARLAKFRDLKRGMMQNLLTGAIRLR